MQLCCLKASNSYSAAQSKFSTALARMIHPRRPPNGDNTSRAVLQKNYTLVQDFLSEATSVFAA